MELRQSALPFTRIGIHLSQADFARSIFGPVFQRCYLLTDCLFVGAFQPLSINSILLEISEEILSPGIFGCRNRLEIIVDDFKKDVVDRQRLESAYELAISEQVAPLKDWAEYAAREIGLAKVDTDPDEWKRRLAKMNAADSKPVIDDSPYNEWLFWHSLGEREQVHDLIITNQLVASVEYSDVDIHPALRGGLTNGATSFSRDSTFGMFAWWSTFAFTSSYPVIVSMRGDETYNPLEAARLAGTGAAHELGHMLFHYGHPFGLSACVMSPTPVLRFREWVSKLDATACKATQHPAMKPGAARVMGPVYAADNKR